MATGRRKGLTRATKAKEELEVIIPDTIKMGWVYIVDVRINDFINRRTSYSIFYHDSFVGFLKKKIGNKALWKIEITRVISKSKQNFLNL